MCVCTRRVCEYFINSAGKNAELKEVQIPVCLILNAAPESGDVLLMNGSFDPGQDACSWL
jgi:hypothetical protein